MQVSFFADRRGKNGAHLLQAEVAERTLAKTDQMGLNLKRLRFRAKTVRISEFGNQGYLSQLGFLYIFYSQLKK